MSQSFWHQLTRLGELQLVLSVAAFAALVLIVRDRAWPLARRWLALLLLAIVLALVSKLAFIGWGIGWASLDFTGVSGHAMMSAAVYPLTLVVLASARSRPAARSAFMLGLALALLVGVSRVAVGAHSWSEVCAAWLLGLSVTGWTLRRHGVPVARAGTPALFAMLVPALCITGVWAMLAWPSPFNSHRVVTRLALALSGHAAPHTRAGLKPAPRGARAPRQRPSQAHAVHPILRGVGSVDVARSAARGRRARRRGRDWAGPRYTPRARSLRNCRRSAPKVPASNA